MEKIEIQEWLGMDKNDLSATMVGASAWLVLSEGIGNFQRASEKSQIHTKIGKIAQKRKKWRKKDIFLENIEMEDIEMEKDIAGGKKTMKAYLWKVCGDEYDQAHNG